jgi:hypothetical protein
MSASRVLLLRCGKFDPTVRRGKANVDVSPRSMNDVDGPYMAERVYSNVFRDGRLDLTAVPYALDDAVAGLRNFGVPESRWATYVHVGA